MKQTMTAALAACLILTFLTGCGQGESGAAPEQADVPVEEILTAIRQAYGEDYPADGEIPPEVLQTEFGLEPDLYLEAKGEMPMISVNNDRVVVVKAAPGKGDLLEQALQDARQRKIEDTLQYPMNIPKTNAAQVVRQGDYLAFLLVGRPDESGEPIDSPKAKEYAEAEVQKAVDAFYSVFSG